MDDAMDTIIIIIIIIHGHTPQRLSSSSLPFLQGSSMASAASPSSSSSCFTSRLNSSPSALLAHAHSHALAHSPIQPSVPTGPRPMTAKKNRSLHPTFSTRPCGFFLVSASAASDQDAASATTTATTTASTSTSETSLFPFHKRKIFSKKEKEKLIAFKKWVC
jgi:hypothetical protein